MDPIVSDLAEEREDNMSSLVARFSTSMRKWSASAQRETTPNSEVSEGKRPKRFGPDEEAQRSLT